MEEPNQDFTRDAVMSSGPLAMDNAISELAGLLVGAKVPVVLTSRADSAESKLLSIASAVFSVDLQRTLWLKVGRVHY